MDIERAVKLVERAAIGIGVPGWQLRALVDEYTRLARAERAEAAQPDDWREHVEQRIRAWRQRTMNKSGDLLAIDDFMGQGSIDDLVDFVVAKILDQLGVAHTLVEKWGAEQRPE